MLPKRRCLSNKYMFRKTERYNIFIFTFTGISAPAGTTEAVVSTITMSLQARAIVLTGIGHACVLSYNEKDCKELEIANKTY